MELAEYLPVLIQILLAFGIAVTILAASQLIGQRAFKRTAIKDSPYECGVISDGKTHTRFSIKFYVTAMLFILFDIEVVFLVPWTLIYTDFLQAGIPVLTPV